MASMVSSNPGNVFILLGVDIIAILETEPVPQIILVSQYRPPLNAHCIEFPAGLITEIEETPISAAMRELQVNIPKCQIIDFCRKKRGITAMKLNYWII